MAVNRSTVQAAPDPLYLAGAVKPGTLRIAQGLYLLSRSIAPCVWQGQGYSQTGGTEHASGRALDIIVSATVGRTPTADERAQGDRLAAWIIDHAEAIGLQWVIWRQRIHNVDRDAGHSWRAMEDRGGTTANHQDHLHVYFAEGADWRVKTQETDMEFNDVVTTFKDSDGKTQKLTVFQGLVRGNYAYQQLISTGWVNRTIAAIKKKVGM